MADPNVLEHLRRIPLFAKLGSDELGALAERLRMKSYKRGDTIFRKDEPGTHLFLVLEGAVKIALPGELGQEALVAFVRNGEFFGELALFDRGPRSATATAAGGHPRRAARRRRLRRVPGVPPCGDPRRARSARRTIRRLSDRVEDLIFLDVPSRVAKYLLDLARVNGGAAGGDLELTLTQDELAAFIGASRVLVNRVLGDLERRELISIRRRKIAIRDADALAREIRV